jgi:hypothetical protein
VNERKFATAGFASGGHLVLGARLCPPRTGCLESQPGDRATPRDVPLGLPATRNHKAGAVLDRTLAPLDGLSSQISLLAERLDASNTADRPLVPPVLGP